MNPIILSIEWHDCSYPVPVGFHPMAPAAASGEIPLAMNKKKESAPPAAAADPVFPMVIRQRGVKAPLPKAKAVKRSNIFSKSRDTREDRGERQIKTAHNAQSIQHGR